jgi:hypothetical protein
VRSTRAARRVATASLAEHGWDGRIHDSDSYGRDPFPLRNKKHETGGAIAEQVLHTLAPPSGDALDAEA